MNALWDVVEREIRRMKVHLKHLQELCDAVMSTWTRISKECLQHLVVLRAKGGPIQCSVPNKVIDLCSRGVRGVTRPRYNASLAGTVSRRTRGTRY
ncbi:hypothetical protein AMELA_G00108810 [Ameiurus melas]|uniref:Uncharacterized protein n=1 Tax=Ameiurus melas TaxID=219545 RepID=A0A7J6ARM5_AMEME|nr:hypothetical protein AMELA_G00108810 [Ameiurus melas]